MALLSPTCSADLLDGLLDDGRRRERGGAAAGLVEEVLEHVGALGRMQHLGVELHAVEAARARLHGRDGRSRARGQHVEAGRRLGDAVAVAHPGLLLAAQPLEEQPRLEHAERRLAELAEVGARHGAAEVERQALHAVADAEHRDAQIEDLGVELRGVVDVHAHGAAGEDDALGRVGLDALDGHVVRHELRVHAALAHAARDELAVLRPEVEHEDGVEPLHLRRALRHSASLSLLWMFAGGRRRSLSPCRRPAPSAASCPRSSATAPP